MAEIFFLAVAAAFWPLLIAIVILALRTPHPARLLGWFLAGGMLTTVGEGAAIVFTLEGTRFATGNKPATDPVLGLCAGGLALAIAAVLAARRNRPRKERKHRPWAAHALERGSWLAFAAGVAFNVFPGLFPLVAMKDIAQQHLGAGAKVALIVAFYAIMFAFVEVPLAGILATPERTSEVMGRFNAWLGRNARLLVIGVLTVAGTYLLVHGLVRLIL